MKAVITGSTGFLGSHIVDYFARDGWEVIATDRPGSDFTANEKAGATVKPLDLVNEDPLPLVEGADVVIHVAGVFDLGAPKDLLHAVNVEAAKKMGEACLRAGVRKMVHISTVGVYGPPAKIPCMEEDRKKPRNEYERTKWEGEKAVVEIYEKKGLPLVVLRPTLIYGPRGKYGHATAIGGFALIKALGRKLKYRIIGGPMAHSVHVEDVARAALFAAKNDEMVGKAFNVADETPVPLGEFFDAISEALDLSSIKSIKYRKWLMKPLGVILLALLTKNMERRINRNLEALWKKVTNKLQMDTPFVPKLDKGWLKYGLADNVYSNERLKKAGFEFKFPDYKQGMKETVRWYIDHGWIPSKSIRNGETKGMQGQ